MLVLVVADAYIPDRATAIPDQLLNLLVPGRISAVASLGNISKAITKSVLRPLGHVKAVRGEFDAENQELPFTETFNAGGLKIGIVSGFTVIPNDDPDALLAVARTLEADVLLWGSSHVLKAHELAGKFFVNPGSITGAYPTTGEVASTTPSFCLLDIEEESCTVYFYSLINNEIKVERVKFKKNEPESS